MPHFSFTMIAFPVSSLRNGFGLTGTVCRGMVNNMNCNINKKKKEKAMAQYCSTHYMGSALFRLVFLLLCYFVVYVPPWRTQKQLTQPQPPAKEFSQKIPPIIFSWHTDTFHQKEGYFYVPWNEQKYATTICNQYYNIHLAYRRSNTIADLFAKFYQLLLILSSLKLSSHPKRFSSSDRLPLSLLLSFKLTPHLDRFEKNILWRDNTQTTIRPYLCSNLHGLYKTETIEFYCYYVLAFTHRVAFGTKPAAFRVWLLHS